MPRDAKLKISEDALQAQCVRWFRMQYPAHLIFAIPNGGLRDVRIARKLKSTGVLAGVPDLFIATPSCGYGGAFIEMKVGYNKPTPLQAEIIARLMNAGYAVSVQRTFDEFVDFVNTYLSKPVTLTSNP